MENKNIKNWIIIPDFILKIPSSKVGGTRKLILGTIWSLGQKQWCTASPNQMSKYIGIPPGTIKNNITKLLQDKYIVRYQLKSGKRALVVTQPGTGGKIIPIDIARKINKWKKEEAQK